jgi:quercetin dioxygenase-like cupin family protein
MRSSGLPPVRRVVTGHDGEGRAVVRGDEHFWTEDIPSGDASFALIWTTAAVPADNNDETDGRARDAALTIHKGSVIRVVDMLPGRASPMHRTNSIDYGIVMSGEVEMELDDGSVTSMGPGSIIVQRGTMHLWRNRSETEPCRIIFVLTEAAPYRFNGEPLPEVHP